MVCSNCDHLKIYIGSRLVADVDPDRQTFPHLTHPPFVVNIRQGINGSWVMSIPKAGRLHRRPAGNYKMLSGHAWHNENFTYNLMTLSSWAMAATLPESF